MPMYICIGNVKANGQEFGPGAELAPEIALTPAQLAVLVQCGAVRVVESAAPESAVPVSVAPVDEPVAVPHSRRRGR